MVPNAQINQMFKFVCINGKMQRVAVDADGHPIATAPLMTAFNPQEALHFPSTMDNIVESEMPVDEAIISAVDRMQSRAVINNFSRDMAPSALIDGLGREFASSETPAGLIANLTALIGPDTILHHLVDDSTSMRAVDGLQNGLQTVIIQDAPQDERSRWQECRHRLLRALRIQSFLPVQKIIISFLNRRTVLTLTQANMTPDQFYQDAEQQVNGVFSTPPGGSSPFARCITAMVQAAHDHRGLYYCYVYMDGQPNDGMDACDRIRSVLLDPAKRTASRNPFAFCSCTGITSDVAWVRELDELPMTDGSPAHITETDDFETERMEVVHDQGEALPYTYGTYEIAFLVGALFPDTLDALDEAVPLTRAALSSIAGVELSMADYQHYWSRFIDNRHHHGTDHHFFKPYFEVFANVTANQAHLQCISDYRRRSYPCSPPPYVQ